MLALEAERKQLFIEKELFHLLQQQLKVSLAEKQMQALQAAVKTMRKVVKYGAGQSLNVEWPTASDLLQMVKNIPTKI